MTDYADMSLHEELETRFADAERRRQEEEMLSRGWRPPAEEHQDLGEQSSSGQRYTQAIRPPKTFGDYFADNAVDMAYGASRTLNGVTGGGFDTFGDKYGYDTQMRGYLRLLPEQKRLQREELAKYLQAGGAMLPVGKAAQVAKLPVQSLLVNAVRWNGRRNLVNQLRRGKDFKDINFGKVDDDTFNQVNDLRRATGYDDLSGNAYIPANVVRKFYNKRLSEGYTPEKMSEMGKRLFHEGGSKVGESHFSHIQEVLRSRDGISEVGYIAKNPSNGKTVIKSIYNKLK